MRFINDPMEELRNAKSAKIVQQIELFEMFTGCETKNRYHVSVKDANKNQTYLFKCKEESGCCVRNFCSSEDRPFDLRVKHILSEEESKKKDLDKVDYAILERPFKCSCFCLAR
jgi:hypothetical protein